MFTEEAIERFHTKYVKRDDGCWIWNSVIQKPGKRNQLPYGVFFGSFNGRYTQMGAHRASYAIHKGAIAKGLHVLHSCDNASCVAPDHLRLGTPADNAMDRRLRDRPPRNQSRRWVSWGEIEVIRLLGAFGVPFTALAKYTELDYHVCKSVVERRTHKIRPEVGTLLKHHGFKIIN